MKKTIFAWILTIIGFILVGFYVIVVAMGRLDYTIVIEDPQMLEFIRENIVTMIYTSFGLGLLMATAGMFMLGKDRIKSRASRDEKNLPEGESIVFRQDGPMSTILVTNKRVRFYGVFTKNLKYSAVNFPASNKEDYFLSEIATTRPVTMSDVASNPLAKKNQNKFGVQLEMKRGGVVNLPTKEGEMLSVTINNNLR